MLAKPVPIGTLAQLNDVTVTTPAADESLAYNGTKWVNKNMGAVSAGAGVSYYLDATVSAGANETLKRIPSGAAEAIDTGIANNNTVFISRYVSDTVLGGTQIDAGTWDFNTYAKVDSAAGVTSIVQRINKRVVKTGTIAITGSGLSRTATVSGATPFVSGDANADITLATLIETPNGTFWITAFTSSSVVTVQMTNAGYTNESGVAYSMYYYLFKASTPTITNTTVALITTKTVQVAFTGITATDKLVAAYFVTTTANQNITASLYYNGTSHYSHIETPLVTRHNDLAGLQGGTTSEYYHLTSAEYTGSGSGIFARATSPVFTTQITTPKIVTASGNLEILPPGNADIVLQGSGTGNVGIGTTAPGAKLTIAGSNVGGAIGTAFQQEIVNTSAAVGDFTGTIYRWIANNPNANQAYIGAVVTSQTTNGMSDIVFGTKNGITVASAITENMRIQAGGNVGIGVTSPLSTLHLKAGTAAANTAPFQFTSGPVEATPRAGIVEYNGRFVVTESDTTNRFLVQAASSTKTTAGAPFTNDGYVTIVINGTSIKIMTTA